MLNEQQHIDETLAEFERLFKNGEMGIEVNELEFATEEQERKHQAFLRTPVVYETSMGRAIMPVSMAMNLITTPHPDTMAAFYLDSQDIDDDRYLPWL
jgi:hypothetical protein